MRTSRFTTILLAAAVVLGGCTSGAGPSPSRSPTPMSPPTPVPSPSPAASFSIDVSPPDEPAASRMAIPGSRYCFLVVVTDPAGGSTPVAITATAERAAVLDVTPASLEPGVVGEVCVAADPTDAETTGSVTITAVRDGATRTVTRSLPVFPMPDERAADARPHFERWVGWLAAEHPEYGITADATVEPVFVSTLLVVSHYSYWFDDWEMTVAWHNMIPPDDWSEVHLRRRGLDIAPSIAYRQDSMAGTTEPREVAPPEVVVR
jgi:hypothetical protein